ncbi:LOW QUALITY PROTEIN: galectin-7-like [Syngnathus typhle]
MSSGVTGKEHTGFTTSHKGSHGFTQSKSCQQTGRTFHSTTGYYLGQKRSINGGLQVGKSITISGWVQPGADRFHVNLQCASNTNADIALHFNPRYVPGYVVANTFRNGHWGTEERKQNFPLPTGSAFNLLITVTSDSYQMNINGTHSMEYKHRISFFQVDTIAIDGKVDISSITFSNPMFAGQPAFPAQPRFPPQPTFRVVLTLTYFARTTLETSKSF